MMRCIPLIMLLAWTSHLAFGQSSALPDSLTNNAHSVVLDYTVTYEVTSDHTATVAYRKEIVLLDPHHGDLRHLVERFDEDTKITSLAAASHDAHGQEIFSARKSDFRDDLYDDGVSFLNDTWLRHVEVPCPSYPCTVTFEASKKLSHFGAMAIPDWLPQQREQGLRRARFTAIIPHDNELLISASRLPEPEIVDDGKTRTFRWSLSNRPPQAEEPLAPVVRETLPYLRLGLGQFRIDDHYGSFRDWNAFGAFMHTLMAGRDVLPDRLAHEVREAVADLTTTEEKVDRLYRLLQEKTRYVSVQLGIGGWQPFSAQYVYTNAYGDCKALSNFMGAMLREVGIESYAVLINAADRVHVPLHENFATSAFNHMILYVPETQTYLECTSKYSPTGYLGETTRGRTVLWITPEGGRLAQTPAAEAGENGYIRSIRLRVKETGEVGFAMDAKFFGAEQELFRAVGVHLPDRQDQLDWLHRQDVLPDVSGDHYAYDISEEEPTARIEYRTTLRNRLRKLGKRRFLTINPYPYRNTPDRIEDRHLPVETTRARTFVDTIHLELPASWKI
jgi:hypothetical protein